MRTRLRKRALSALVGLVAVLVILSTGLLALPSVADASVSYSAEELTFLDLLNQYREAHDLGALLLSDDLSDAADKHGLDMGTYEFVDHTTRGSDLFAVRSSPWDRMAACGYDYNTYMGENISVGHASAQLVFEGWKNSPGHDANMLNPEFKVIGISLETVLSSPYTYYWVTDFGGFVDASAHGSGGPGGAGITPPEPSQVFADVRPDDRFYLEITTLAAAFVIGGYADSSFRPDDQVTRAQFAKILMLAIGRHTEAVENIDHPAFSDVPYDGRPYPFDFVQEAAGLGIIVGNQDGSFGPFSFITRTQLALMLVRAGGAALDLLPAGYTLPFDDVPGYAADAIAVACYNGLLSGTTATTFDPDAVATRGQVAKMIYNLMELLRR